MKWTGRTPNVSCCPAVAFLKMLRPVCSTRIGGVSLYMTRSTSVFSRGDNPGHVEENRKRRLRAICCLKTGRNWQNTAKVCLSLLASLCLKTSRFMPYMTRRAHLRSDDADTSRAVFGRQERSHRRRHAGGV